MPAVEREQLQPRRDRYPLAVLGERAVAQQRAHKPHAGRRGGGPVGEPRAGSLPRGPRLGQRVLRGADVHPGERGVGADAERAARDHYEVGRVKRGHGSLSRSRSSRR